MRLFHIAFPCALVMSASVQANVLQYDLDKSYTSSTKPAGAPAWLRIRADDGGSNGSVTLRIESLTLTGDEFVSKLMLNVRSPIVPANLSAGSFAPVGTFATPEVSFGQNAFNAGGGSSFDMLVSFATGGPGNRFGPGDALTMTITGSSLLNSNTFNALSSGGSGALLVSAHVQGISGGDGSAWITALAPTPEPGSAMLVGAMTTLLSRRRR